MREIMPYYKIKIGLRATKVGVGLGSMKELEIFK